MVKFEIAYCLRLALFLKIRIFRAIVKNFITKAPNHLLMKQLQRQCLVNKQFILILLTLASIFMSRAQGSPPSATDLFVMEIAKNTPSERARFKISPASFIIAVEFANLVVTPEIILRSSSKILSAHQSRILNDPYRFFRHSLKSTRAVDEDLPYVTFGNPLFFSSTVQRNKLPKPAVFEGLSYLVYVITDDFLTSNHQISVTERLGVQISQSLPSPAMMQVVITLAQAKQQIS